MMRKTDYTGLVALILYSLVCALLFVFFILKPDPLKQNRKQKEYYENLVVEELVEMYGSEEYTYVIEELDVDSEDCVFVCIIKFYDGKNYNESIMYVTKSGFVYTELEILEVTYEKQN